MNTKIVTTHLILLGTAALVAGQAIAQSLPRLKPLPPKKDLVHLAAVSANIVTASSSTRQMLTNQPPVLDSIDCGRQPGVAHRRHRGTARCRVPRLFGS